MQPFVHEDIIIQLLRGVRKCHWFHADGRFCYLNRFFPGALNLFSSAIKMTRLASRFAPLLQ